MDDWTEGVVAGVVSHDDRELMKLVFLVALLSIMAVLAYKSYTMLTKLMWKAAWSVPVFLFWDLVRCDLYRILRRVTSLNIAVCECSVARGDTLYGLAMLILRHVLRFVGFSQEDIADRLINVAVDTLAKKVATNVGA